MVLKNNYVESEKSLRQEICHINKEIFSPGISRNEIISTIAPTEEMFQICDLYSARLSKCGQNYWFAEIYSKLTWEVFEYFVRLEN